MVIITMECSIENLITKTKRKINLKIKTDSKKEKEVKVIIVDKNHLKKVKKMNNPD